MQPKFYIKQQTLGINTALNFEKKQGQIVYDHFAPIIFRILDKHRDAKQYELAQRTYKVLYNNIQFRSKTELKKLYFPGDLEEKKRIEKEGSTVEERIKNGTLKKNMEDDKENENYSPIELTSLMGKPILLTPNNMNPLITEDYYVSTKANGLRFILMLSNDEFQEKRDRGIKATEEMQFTHKSKRFIFFIDSKLNFWTIETAQKAQEHLFIMDIDKCLIDGEILFFADNIEPVINQETKLIDKYILSTINKQSRPSIIFLAFDMLFGPMNPSYEYERHVIKGVSLEETKKINDTYVLKTDVKDTTLIFGSSNNMLGHKTADRWNARNRRLIMQEMFINTFSSLHAQFKRIYEVVNFTVILSPFMDFEDVLFAKDPYEYAKKIYYDSLNTQYKKITGSTIKTLSQNGLETDGFIITPIKGEYIENTWSLGNNKQYKWKPKDELTIDVEITSSDIKKAIENKTFLVECYVRGFKGPYNYNNKKVLISIVDNWEELINRKDPIIVECFYQESPIIENYKFGIKLIRSDKKEPNAILAVDSNMDQLVGPVADIDILEIIKKLRLYYKYRKGTENDIKEISTIISTIISPENLKRNTLCISPIDYIISLNENKYIDRMLDLVYNNMNKKQSETGDDELYNSHTRKSFELESRIDIRDSRDIGKLIVKEYLKESYNNYPMVRLYKDDYRITFIELGPENLVLQEVSKKKTIDNEIMPKYIYNDLYKRVAKINTVLAQEIVYENDMLSEIILGKKHNNKLTREQLEDIINKDFDSEYAELLINDKEKKEEKKEDEIVEEKEEKEEKEEEIVKEKSYKITKTQLIKRAKNLLKYLSNKDLVLSISKDMFVEGIFQYQSRHVINNLSDFWSVEIIKYGSSFGKRSSYKQAYENYLKGPNVENGLKTRIEIEYKPLEYYSDILKFIKYYGQKTPKDILEKYASKFDIKKEEYENLNNTQLFNLFEKYINKELKKISKLDPQIILQDYFKVIFKLLYSVYYS